MRFSESMSASCVIDSNQLIVSFEKNDKRLFFDKKFRVGDLLIDDTDLQKHEGLQLVIDSLHRAVKYNRGICLEYTSSYGEGLTVCVGLVGEWDGNGAFSIYLNPLEELTELKILDKSDDNSLNFAKQWDGFNDLYQRLLEIMPMGIAVFDDSGDINYTNQEYEHIFGASDNKKTRSLFETHLPIEEHFYKLRNGHKVEFDFECDLAALSYLHVIYVPINYINSCKNTYLAIIEDVSQGYNEKAVLNNILNSMPFAILIKDVENDKYTFCNDASKRMLSVDVGMSTKDIFEGDLVEYICNVDMSVYKTGAPYLDSERLSFKDGKTYDTFVRKSVVDYGDQRNILILRWDESTTNSLKQESKLLKVKMEELGAHIWKLEFESTNRKSFLTNDLDAKSKLDTVHPDDRSMVFRSFIDAINNNLNVWTLELRADLNDEGIYSWWEAIGNIEHVKRNGKSYTQIYGLLMSIESHKQNEQILLDNQKALNELIRQNSMIMNNTNSGLVYIDTNYRVVWKDDSAHGLHCGDFKIGECCYTSAFNLKEPCVDCLMKRVLNSSKLEYKKIIFDDSSAVDVYANPVFDAKKQIEGIVIRIDDATDREKMIKQLEEARLKAEESDRLKTAFLANMSHEIRTPLNAIIGFSALMADATPEESEEYFNIINHNSNLLLKLINDILYLSKIDAGLVTMKYETIDMYNCFGNVLASVSGSIESSKVRFEFDNTCGECIVSLDEDGIVQLLTNYLTNAIKYTTEGLITLGYRLENKGVYIYVKDTGVGISEEKQALVFNRFEKLDEFAQGTGLGLAICKAVVEAMNGELGFESTKDVGSLFWAFLPLEMKINE